MKWVWIVLAAVAVLVAIVAATGAMLPVGHIATRRARYRQTPEAVWAEIAREKTFREDNVDYEVTEFAPPRRMVTRITQKNLPYGGSWTYQIEPAPSGCELRITENGEVYNPIFRFMSRFVIGHTATIDARLRALAVKFGEPAVID